MPIDHGHGLFPALLKQWRHRRGMSQLDLAVAADVSSRHVSFLETGRSTPSEEMVLRLATTLGVPLRHVDALLRAAGHAPRHGSDEATPGPTVRRALNLLKEHHDPFPLLVVDRCYSLVDLNTGAAALLTTILGGLPGADGPRDLVRLTFSPAGARPWIVNFDEVGRALLWRLQREVLEDPDDGPLRRLLDDVLAMPTVDPSWRDVDLTAPSDPTLVLHLRRDELDLHFLTMVTAFQVPQLASVEDLRIETWLPADEATAEACRRLVVAATAAG